MALSPFSNSMAQARPKISFVVNAAVYQRLKMRVSGSFLGSIGCISAQTPLRLGLISLSLRFGHCGVPQEKLNTCLNILNTLGYRSDKQQQAKHVHHHHCAPLFRPGDYGTIEIHRDPIFPSAAHLLPTQVAWEHVEPLKVEGLEMNVLSPSYRILHNILHSEVIDRNYASGLINVRSLHETVAANLKHGKKIDWLDLQTLMDYHGKGDVLRAHLYLAHRLFGMKIPDGIRPRLRCTAHYARSRLQLRSVWVTNWITRWVWKIHQFSTYSICGRYGYDAVPIWLAIGRLRYACNRLSRYRD